VKAVSAAFVEAVSRPHDVVFRADVTLGGVSQIVGLPLEPGGSVTQDRRQAMRGSATFIVPGLKHVPLTVHDNLAPIGQEVRIWAGIRRVTGAVDEMVSLGIFRLDETNSSDTGDVTSQVQAPDRSAAVSDADLIRPYPIAAGTNMATAIQAFIAAGVPGLQYQFSPTSFVTPPLVFVEGDDRWLKAIDMAASIGMELFFNGDGVCVMQPEPTLLGPPDAELIEGESGILMTIDRGMSRRGRVNGVLVLVESSSLAAPLRSLAVDNDPASVTYWGTDENPAAFGHVTATERTNLPTNQGQADTMAEGLLRARIGIVTSGRGSAVPNFAIEPSDRVRLRASRLGLDETAILDQVVMPLDPLGAMTFETRARQVTA
jgi:hypothetical protein